jgi:hypothetical protein
LTVLSNAGDFVVGIIGRGQGLPDNALPAYPASLRLSRGRGLWPSRCGLFGRTLLLGSVLTRRATADPPAPYFTKPGVSQSQADMDLAACCGRTMQTALTMPTPNTGSAFGDLFVAQNRRSALDQVMAGCMAEKGYTL